MRILHTSDWHIGKKLNRISRIDEQKEVLSEICGICEENKIELVLIAGDIYDTFMPSSEAEDLFFDVISRLATKDRAVVIISGNHDDAERLCASRYLASRSNVYIFGGSEVPCVGKDNLNVRAVETGTNHVVISSGKEKVYIGLLPYPGEQKYNEKRDERTYSEKMQGWISECFKDNTENLPEIFMSHIFMMGGVGTDGERKIELGGVKAVDRKVIPDEIIYTALGHLHKRQIIDRERNIIYSGSPLQYSFDEVGTEKSVTMFEVKDGKVENLEVKKLESGKQLAKVVALSLEEGKELLERYRDYRVHLTLSLNTVLSDSETKELAGNYPCLTELMLEIRSNGEEQKTLSRKNMDNRQLFAEYYRSRYSEEIPEDILNAYLELINEVEK